MVRRWVNPQNAFCPYRNHACCKRNDRFFFRSSFAFRQRKRRNQKGDGSLTHVAFYAVWPNAWAAFRKALEVYADDDGKSGGPFGLGELNTAFAQFFVGNSYLKPLTDPHKTVFMANVTFEPKCRNHWHIHKAASGGGQILLCVDGRGWYVEEGKEPRELHPGDVVTIPANVKHWHGAAKDSWFSHIAVECLGESTKTEWCEAVSEEEYNQLN